MCESLHITIVKRIVATWIEGRTELERLDPLEYNSGMLPRTLCAHVHNPSATRNGLNGRMPIN